jgi:voltage-gated potassium channel
MPTVKDNEVAQPAATAQSEAIPLGKPAGGWRLRLHEIIFESDTAAGRRFDVLLIVAICVSVGVVLADSVASVSSRHAPILDKLEWFFTLLFTVEYVARLLAVRHPLRYATSFFGVVDLIAILPSYLAIFFPEAQLFIDVRVLRLLRIFRIFKLTEYISEYRMLGNALRASGRKIAVFLSVVVMVVLIVGTLMYVLEGPAHGFTSIPVAVYWAISTMTTVGYGDLVPHTDIGRALASIIMLLGWGILAVPTGIVTAEMTAQRLHPRLTTAKICPECLTEGHDSDAAYCRKCGAPLRSS